VKTTKKTITGTRSVTQSRPNRAKPPLRRRGAARTTMQAKSIVASVKSSVQAKPSAAASSSSSNKRKPSEDSATLSPVTKKKGRTTNVSPVFIRSDAIRFVNKSGHTEIVRIDHANRSSSKHRRYCLKWYNEYGGEVTERWEYENSSFWSFEPEYLQLLNRYCAKHPPPRLVSLTIDDDDDDDGGDGGDDGDDGDD
jgi:hypothetical protein